MKTNYKEQNNKKATNQKRTVGVGLAYVQRIYTRGITLIALVITIIVLLILASVAINLTLGDNGIFTKAREAKERTEIANVKERVQMDILGERMQNNGNIEDKVLKEILNKYFSDVPEDEEITEDMVLTTKEEYGGEYPIKVSDIYSKNTNQEEGTNALPTESYVGYYADIDGINGVDGIIFIDRVSGAQGDGEWSGEWGKYTIDTIDSSEAKEYYISKETYKPEGTDFEEKPIIKAKNIASNASKKDRFYVMALNDLEGGKIIRSEDGTKTINTSPYFCWYHDAYNKASLNRIENYKTDTEIGTGKTNTEQMIADWNNNSETYGAQDDGSYIDIWGHIPSTRNTDGSYTVKWFVPSRAEWSAFCGEVMEKNNPVLTTDNYGTVFGLSSWYWSSSQIGTDGAFHAYFDSGCIGGDFVSLSYCVRLATTF